MLHTLDLAPFRRYETPMGVEYEILSRHKTCYYTVHLLGGVALDCECDRFVKGHKKCGHMDTAEKEERLLNPPSIPVSYAQAPRQERGQLNGEAGFRFMR